MSICGVGSELVGLLLSFKCLFGVTMGNQTIFLLEFVRRSLESCQKINSLRMRMGRAYSCVSIIDIYYYMILYNIIILLFNSSFLGNKTII